jgi:cobalamin biosynthesis Mg chelatase CobN
VQSNTSTPLNAADKASNRDQAPRLGRFAALLCALVACFALGLAATASAQSPGTDQYTEPPPTGGGEPTDTNAPGGSPDGTSGGGDSGSTTTTGSPTTSTTSDDDAGSATSADGGDTGSGKVGEGDDKSKDGSEGSSGTGDQGAGEILSGAPQLATAESSGDELWRSIWLPLLLVLSLIVAVGIRIRNNRSTDS